MNAAVPVTLTPARTNVTHEQVSLGSFRHLTVDRSGFQVEFARRLLAEPGLSGRVLDVGCGAQPQPALEEVIRRAGHLDGVDPAPPVGPIGPIHERWIGTLESAHIPHHAYDLAYSYNVVEHVAHAQPFFGKLRQVLKPGGVYWSLTPHGYHPFCSAVRLLELLKLKPLIARHDHGVNPYPSYYRLNRDRDVLRAIRGLGFSSARFVYMPCMQWDRAFPRLARWLPWTYDFVAGTRFKRAMLILAYRLEVAG
jgi:SAM-dependent methyltransferase